MVDPFQPHPTPWTSEFEPDENRWYILDAHGNEVFVSMRFVTLETVNFLIRAVNKHGDN